MKKKLALFLAVAMLLTAVIGVVSVSAEETNPLSIGVGQASLRIGFEGEDLAYGYWNQDVVDTEAHSGTHSTKVTGNGSYASFMAWTGGGKLVKDQAYLVSFWAKGPAGTKLEYDFESYGEGKAEYSETSRQLAGEDWEKIEFIVVPLVDPINNDHVVNGYPLRLLHRGSETLYLDDITIRPLGNIETTAGVEIVNWFLSWGYDGDTTTDTDFGRWTMDGAGLTGTDGIIGSGALLTKVGTYAGQYFWTGAGNMEPGKTYLAAFYVKGAVGQTIVTDLADGGIPGASYTLENDDWTLCLLQVTIPEDKLPMATGYAFRVFSTESFSIDEVRFGTVKENTPPTPPEEKSNLFDRDNSALGGFVAFEPTKDAGYAAYYIRTMMDVNKAYTVEFKAISNTAGAVLMVDLENLGGIGASPSVTIAQKDAWDSYSVTLTPTEKWQESSNADTARLGWPLRVYFDTKVDAQIFIDDLVVKDADNNVVFTQNFDALKPGGIEAWLNGKATHIPNGYVPPSEDEVLGYNELINGDFESADLMRYWWSRTDWNGGLWQREEGMGVDGSAGLVARGRGEGTSIQNAGVFYTLAGEGSEASLELKAGETYVLKYKAFRPQGVDSYLYIDINEKGVVSADASKNGEWEEVTVRFVAPEGPVKIRAVVNALAEGEYVVIDDIELRQVGGDPNGSPRTGDDTPVALLAVAMLVSFGACSVFVSKKFFCK